MQRVEAVVIGGGQAGLAMSHCLVERGIDHVVLERGRVGERWRSERWDSLRLLTPRWMSRLPGWEYEGPDPDGFMTKDELAAWLEAYAASFGAPVWTGVSVTHVGSARECFLVRTWAGSWCAYNVVIPTGYCQEPAVPSCAAELPDDIMQMVPSRYRRPHQLPLAGVLVVGASATGIQLAAELRDSGRPVTLAVGRHTRLPRTWRGRDILEWLDRMGVLAERADRVADLEASRAQPSLQLVGTPDRRTLDLDRLQASGVRLVGRVEGVTGPVVHLGDNLLEDATAADLKLLRLLQRIDDHIAEEGLDCPAGELPGLTRVPETPASLDLRAKGIGSVLWATGFRRSYPWLDVPVLDESGEIRHEGGITPCPGLYVMGLGFLRRRSSTFIDGQRFDAAELADHLAGRRSVPAVCG